MISSKLLTHLFMALVVPAQPSHRQSINSHVSHNHVKNIIAIFHELPSWVGADLEDINGRDNRQSRQLRNVVSKLQPYTIDEIEQAIKVVAADYRSALPNEFGPFSFITFTRAFFQVSEKANDDFVAHRWIIGQVNEMWPLDYDKNGLLIICYHFRGYQGPPFRALNDFQYYREHFPRRTSFYQGPCTSK